MRVHLYRIGDLALHPQQALQAAQPLLVADAQALGERHDALQHRGCSFSVSPKVWNGSTLM